jgi:DNA-binding LytR/AlgR family response regulator
MYNCIIIDDEEHAIEGLKKYIEAAPELNLLKSFMDPVHALNEIKGMEGIDLVLLDIDMPGVNGIDLAKIIRHKTQKLVFTTGHSKYAYEAFEIEADAYLLKPYNLAKFLATIMKLFPSEVNAHSTFQSIADEPYFYAKNREDNLKLTKVNYTDICSIESQQNYIKIHLVHGSVVTYMSLTEMMKMLSKRSNFLHVQRSFVVNMDQVLTIDGNLLQMMSGPAITVGGDKYRGPFLKYVEDKLIRVGKVV